MSRVLTGKDLNPPVSHSRPFPPFLRHSLSKKRCYALQGLPDSNEGSPHEWCLCTQDYPAASGGVHDLC